MSNPGLWVAAGIAFLLVSRGVAVIVLCIGLLPLIRAGRMAPDEVARLVTKIALVPRVTFSPKDTQKR